MKKIVEILEIIGVIIILVLILGVSLFKFKGNTNSVSKKDNQSAIYCTFDGELKPGTEYVNDQYTYRYKQEYDFKIESGYAWNDINNDGWGVKLTDLSSTNSVTSKLCTYINDKPIVSMSHMFNFSKSQSIDLSNFNTSNVTNMRGMFFGSDATIIKGLEKIDTSKVTNMESMFSYSQAASLDLSNFNTESVIDMSNMFEYNKATTLNISNFDTKNVINMNNMFEGSKALSLDLSSFDTGKVKNMNNMFTVSDAMIIKGLEKFDTSNVNDMRDMFNSCQATTLDLSNFDTSNVINMSGMFAGTHIIKLDLSYFNTSNVTDMSGMFSYAENLETIYVGKTFDTNKVISSSNMFNNCVNLVGGAGTKYNSNHVDKTYARIDDNTRNPGYFTNK